MSKAVGLSDEHYEKVAKLAEEADLSIMQVVAQLMSYALERASVVREIKMVFEEPYQPIPIPAIPTPIPRPSLIEPSPVPNRKIKRGRPGLSGSVMSAVNAILIKAGRPLSIAEITQQLREMGIQGHHTSIYHSKHIIRHDTTPVTFSAREG